MKRLDSVGILKIQIKFVIDPSMRWFESEEDTEHFWIKDFVGYPVWKQKQ
jgi:hypothetical protein